MVDLSDLKGFIDVIHVFDGNVTRCLTQIDHRGEKLQHSHHFCLPLSGGSQETPNRKMLYLVVIIIKMSHDTFHSSANYHYSDREVLYRSKIGDNVDEISHTCHFGLGNAT